jgi:oligo-1,6-glucosidase
MAWWQSAVVYQIYPRSFADSDGDGIGDLGGIAARLDYLAELGIDVLWLSPIYPSPQDDNGYDISDYRDIDPTFGTLADFDALLEAVHERGMKLVMDLVVNHTSDEHPWFVESRSSRDNPKRDWYWWRDEPTNWRSFFSGPTWDLDPQTGQYYLHLFSRKQPDLNWENPEVREAIYSMMRWWLDRGVDGFRMDVINMLSKDPALPDGPGGDGSPYYLCGPRIHEFLQEMHREVFAGRDGEPLTVGEMPGVTLENAKLFTDPARGEVDMVFQFEHVQLDQGTSKWDIRPLRLTDLKRSLGRWQSGLAERGWNSLYWNNHDQPRVVSRFGDGSPRAAKMLGTVLHLHRGTPYVYQGEELGMTNYPFTSIDEIRDIETLGHYAEAGPASFEAVRAMGRDNARTPMQWDASAHAGFTTGRPWLPVNPNHTEINAEAQRDDPDSVFHHYRRLIELRHSEPAVAHGDFTMLLEDDERIYAFMRRLEDTELLVLGNFCGDEVTVDLTGWEDAELLIGEPGVALRPWEGRVYRRYWR